MMLAYPNLLETTVTGPAPVPVPVIKPMSAPVYIQPVSVPMVQDPAIAPPPPDQFRGEGGTAFGTVPQIYVQRPVLNGDRGDLYVAYTPPPNDAYNPNAPVTTPPETKARPGDSTIQPVPAGQIPTKPAVGDAVEPVTVPKSAGPIKGQLLGFDLGLVPFWAWVVGAALIGARVLR